MRTNDSSSGREQKISLALCLPSNRRAWRDVSSLGTRQNTTSEQVIKVSIRHPFDIQIYRGPLERQCWLSSDMNLALSKSQCPQGVRILLRFCGKALGP